MDNNQVADINFNGNPAAAAAPQQGGSNYRNNDNWRRRGQNNSQKRGSRNRGGGRPPVNTNAPRAQTTLTEIPQGQYLSKVPSALTNDPLSEKAYFPGPSEEFRAVVGRQKIYPTCTNLPELMEQSYTKVVSVSPSFGKTVPRSAYDYYIAVIVYYRMLLLHQKNSGDLTIGELNFLAQMENAIYTVPKSVSLYLSGIGSTKAPKSRYLEFALDKPTLKGGSIHFGENGEINIPGYFGPIIENLGFYASYPSTGVYAQAIAMDLLRTRIRDRPSSWDLPEEFSYPNHPITQNCLGYQFAKYLTPECVRFYEDINVSPDMFEFENLDVAFNSDIMAAVHIKLTDSRISLYPIATTNVGSVGQIAVNVVSQQTTTRACGAQWESQTAFELPSTEGYLGATFGYITRKDYAETRTIKSLMPIHYAASSHIPLEQREQLNHAYALTTDFVKTRLYAVVPFSISQRIESVIQHDNAG